MILDVCFQEIQNLQVARRLSGDLLYDKLAFNLLRFVLQQIHFFGSEQSINVELGIKIGLRSVMFFCHLFV